MTIPNELRPLLARQANMDQVIANADALLNGSEA